MQSAVQIEVYPTDAEAADAAAALVAVHARAAGKRATVAIGAGRAGRPVLVALASTSDLPWNAVEWFLADERCGATPDPLAHATVAKDSLFGPRGVPAARIHAPRVENDARAIATAYAATLAERLGPDGVLDVVVLAIGPDGALGSLTGDVSADAGASVAAVPGDPPRVTITPALIDRARHVVVTAIGPDTANAVAAALRDGRGPAARALPSSRVTWVVDRAAAERLLADAKPVDPPAH
jgi:6-phosphogluconolactonase